MNNEQNRTEQLELVVLIAKDIVALWPTITFRTLGKMTEKVALLGAALKVIGNN